MNFDFTPEQEQIRRTIQEICRDFPNEYWRELDTRRSYPEKFVDTLTQGGWLAAWRIVISRRKKHEISNYC